MRIFALLAVMIFASFLAPELRAKSKQKELPKISCKAVTNQCAICSDLKSRKIKHMNNANKKNSLKASAFQCASMGKLTYNIKQKTKVISEVALKLKKCKVVSDFCAICPDGKYVFTTTAEEIASDPYECATSPRTQKGI